MHSIKACHALNQSHKHLKKIYAKNYANGQKFQSEHAQVLKAFDDCETLFCDFLTET